MSLCYRTLPKRFTSLVNPRKYDTKIDRQLPSHVKSSLFLKQFFNARLEPMRGINLRRKVLESTLAVHNNSSLSSLLSCEKQPDLMSKGIKNDNHVPRVRLYRVPRYKPGYYQNSFYCEVTRNADLITKDKGEINYINGVRQKCMVLTNPTLNAEQKNGETPMENSEKKPQESLVLVYECLRKDLPNLFTRSMNYQIYTEDLVFVNNIRGNTHRGLGMYVMLVSLLQVLGHIKYAYIKMNVLKMTIHPEDNSVKVRWRIAGIGILQALKYFYKTGIVSINVPGDQHETWYDGFSTFYVNLDGKVYKHVVDKVMPDQDVQKVEKTKTPITAKLALFLGLFNIKENGLFCSKKNSHLLLLK